MWCVNDCACDGLIGAGRRQLTILARDEVEQGEG